jgi:hypothetical protein
MNIQVASGPRELDIVDWMARLALELIGQAGLGYSFKTLCDIEAKDNKYNTFASALKQLS